MCEPRSNRCPAVVRDARRDDVPELHAFIRGLAEYEQLLDRLTATEADLDHALFGPIPVAQALVCEDDGVAVGFAVFYTTYSTFRGRPGIYLEDLYVDPAHRGRGCGYALLQRVAQIAVDRGCARLEWAVLDWNAPSIAFYRRLGAICLDDWSTYRLSGPALGQLAEPSGREQR